MPNTAPVTLPATLAARGLHLGLALVPPGATALPLANAFVVLSWNVQVDQSTHDLLAKFQDNVVDEDLYEALVDAAIDAFTDVDGGNYCYLFHMDNYAELVGNLVRSEGVVDAMRSALVSGAEWCFTIYKITEQ